MNTSPAVFFSYTRADDKREGGKLSQTRKALEEELCVLSGDDWTVFQDIEHIEIGEQWKKRLAEGVSGSTFFLPILTPTYLKRPVCRDELTQFLDRERELGRDDLVFSVLYVDTPLLNDKHLRESDQLAVALTARKWDDWRELRDYQVKTTKVRRKIRGLAKAILAANNRVHAPSKPVPVPSQTQTRILSSPLPPLSERWQERIHSVVTIGWRLIPLTAMISEWLRVGQFEGLPNPELLNYPALKFGLRAMDLVEELYLRIRAQVHPTTKIEWTPALKPFGRELSLFESARFLTSRHTITGSGEVLRLRYAFIVDLALLCDDLDKSVRLDEIVKGAKKSLNGAELSEVVGLPLIVVDAFFWQYEQQGRGNTSKTIGESQYYPYDVCEEST